MLTSIEAKELKYKGKTGINTQEFGITVRRIR